MINEGDPRVQYERCDDTGLFSADLAMTEDRFFQFSGIEPAFWDTGITNYSDYLSEMQAGNIYTIFGGSGAPPSGSDYILPDLVSDQVCDGLAPIHTGIRVVTVDNFNQSTETIPEHDEHFCANPECFYDFMNDKCVAASASGPTSSPPPVIASVALTSPAFSNGGIVSSVDNLRVPQVPVYQYP